MTRRGRIPIYTKSWFTSTKKIEIPEHFATLFLINLATLFLKLKVTKTSWHNKLQHLATSEEK